MSMSPSPKKDKFPNNEWGTINTAALKSVSSFRTKYIKFFPLVYRKKGQKVYDRL